jgi:hypothetical protein
MKEQSIARLNISIEDLYAEKKQIRVHVQLERNRTPEFSVILIGRDKQPDCKISSWGENIWFRTSQGQNRKQYSSIQSLQKAIINAVKAYYSCSDVMFTLSDEIDII